MKIFISDEKKGRTQDQMYISSYKKQNKLEKEKKNLVQKNCSHSH